MKINPLLYAIRKQTWLISPDVLSSNAFVLSSLLAGKLDFAQDTPVPVRAFVDDMDINVSADTGMSMVDFSKTKPGTILLLPIHGTMFKHGGLCSWGMTDIETTLVEASQNANVIGAVLDIDSGGGEAGSVAPVINGIRRMQAKGKPVVSFSDISCSAAYWVSASTNQIIAANNISASFGSIGVMCQFIDAIPVLKQLGYEVHTIFAEQSTEKNKAFQLALEGKYEQIQKEMLNPLALQFISEMKKARNLSLDEEHTIYKGAVLYAQDALKTGIIDAIGSLDDAIAFINANSHKKSSKHTNHSNLNYTSMKLTKILPFIGLTAIESTNGTVSLSKEQIETLTRNFKSNLNIDVTFKELQFDEENAALLSMSVLEQLEEQIPNDFTFDASQQQVVKKAESNDTNKVVVELIQKIDSLNLAMQRQKQEHDASIAEIKKVAAISGTNKPLEIHVQRQIVPMLKKEIKSRDRTIVGSYLFGEQQSYLKVDDSRPWNIAAQQMLFGYTGTPSLNTDVNIDQINQDFGEFLTGRKGDVIKWFAPDDDFNKIFPVITNAKESDIYMSLNLDEITQGYQKTWTPKGEFKFQGRKIRLFDIKIDLTFEDLKAIERTWLSEFNAEGSHAYKMALLEYLVYIVAEKAVVEDQIAMIDGRFISPIAGLPGYYLHKMDGLREILFQLIENRIAKPFTHIGAWTKGNTVEFVREFILSIPEAFRSRPNLGFYAPDQFVEQYWEDRKMTELNMKAYTDSKTFIPGFENIRIMKYPYAGNSKRVFVTPIGNIRQLLGFKDSERPRFEIEKSRRVIDVFSDYKKAMHIILAGWESETDQEFEERDYDKQLIWFNNIDLPANAPMNINPNQTVLSAKRHHVLRTVENSVPTAITNITHAKTGKPIIVVCGSIINASTIANAGKFILSSGNFEPLEIGESITLLPRSDGKFVEMYRSAPSDEPISIEFDADDTTPSVADDNFFKTSSLHTAARTITNLEDAVVDEVYKIYGNDGTHATTISNGGNFVLSATWTGATGNYLVLRFNGVKFFEIDRQS